MKALKNIQTNQCYQRLLTIWESVKEKIIYAINILNESSILIKQENVKNIISTLSNS